MKLKTFLLYTASMIFILFLTASFESQFYVESALSVNLGSEAMYLAYAGDPGNPPQNPINVIEDPTIKKNTYVQGESSPFIQEYKKILYYLGRLKNYDTDVFDKDMQTAVSLYQQAKTLNDTGTLDLFTMNALDSEPLTFIQGHKGSEIIPYQEVLKSLGYLKKDYKAEGNFDDTTYLAVIKYQKNNLLEQTGRLNPETRAKMESDIYQQVPAGE